MADWVEVDGTGSREREWLHVPTGVVLFVGEQDDGYGVYIRSTEDGQVDRVSIGDPETGRFRTFDERERAVDWADEWKASDDVRKALESTDPSDSTTT